MTSLKLGAAILRGAVASAFMASAMSTSVLAAPPVDLSKWSPDYVQVDRRHQGFRYGRRLRQGHPARLQGPRDILVPGRLRGRPRYPAPELQGLLRGVPGDLPEHHARGPGPHLQRSARQVPHRAARQCRADGGASADPGRHRVRRQGLSAAAEARGCRLFDRRFLARRHEGRHLAGQDLRRPDQQRDDGVHLERRYLQACRARSRQGAGDLGRRRQVFQADPRQARRSPATAWSRARTPATRPTASCPSCGPMAAACSTKPTANPTYKDRSSSTARRAKRRSAGLLRHVCPRQVGAGLGAHQPADRQPAALPRRPARHDDLASVRLSASCSTCRRRRPARTRQGADRHRQHALRPDPDRPDGKRAVVFGGSNIHILKPEYVDGGKVDMPAAKALICFWTGPEWSLKLAWVSSNPGNLAAS